MNDFGEQRTEILNRAIARRAEAEGNLARITDIWAGEKEGDTPLVVLVRNDDNGFVSKPGVAVGDFPRTSWVLDLPILELMLYNGAVINFDLFDGIAPMLAIREGFGLLRRTAEENFLRFLPADQRQAIYESWYEGELTEMKREREIDSGPDTTLETGIEFETDNPKTEFQAMLLEHIGFTETADPINRPQPGDGPDPVTAALISIVEASKQQPDWLPFKTLMPQAVFLRINTADGEPTIYTMSQTRFYLTKAFATSLLQEEDPSRAELMIYPGVQTAYPNFMFDIDAGEAAEFAEALIAVETPEDLTAVVERWGVRRSSPDFWAMIDSVTEYVRRTDPLKAATFDVNRYKNL